MKIDFAKGAGLVPAVIQDATTGCVLMLGYMNSEALEETKKTGKVHFFSRSKNRLWMKGESSGNILEFVSVSVDCDADSLLIQARPQGPTCHNGTRSCFEDAPEATHNFLKTLEQIVVSRKGAQVESSYVATLFNEGTKKIAQKVIEEAGEVALEAMARNHDLFLGEAADLLFHYLVLLADYDTSVEDILTVLKQRHQKRK
jgi:phosphoribosyl-ATP pyrophosphohydrolase/phosphoribosyl-AMP cyclohydrolase